MITSVVLVLLATQLPAVGSGPTLDQPQIEKVFERVCNYESIAAPNSIGDFVAALPTQVDVLAREVFLTHVPVYVDEPMLARNGVNLDHATSWGFNNILVEGVSLRSSLRFILDSYGFSYYVGEGQVVITTKPNARAMWLTQLKRPDPTMLDSGTRDERRATAFAAGFWNIDPDRWVATLINSLWDTDRQIVFDAAFALGELGPTAEAAIVPLIDNLRSGDGAIRESSVGALAKIGSSAIDMLLKQVDDPDSPIATAAVRSLGMMGHVGKDAIPRLIEIGNHSDDIVLRRWLCNTLVSLDPFGSVSGAQDRMKSERPSVKVFAIEIVSDVGRLRLDRVSTPNLEEIAQEILGLLSDQNTDVRRAAACALWSIDLPVDTSLDPLEKALHDVDSEVRGHAGAALHLLKSKKAKHAIQLTPRKGSGGSF